MKIDRMCIFDLDGTMDLTDKKLNGKILRMSKNGMIFVTATGRTNNYVRETCRMHGIMPPRFIIADNGGTIYDNVEKKYIMRTTLNVDVRNKVLREFIKLGGIPDDIRYTDGDNVFASKSDEVKRYYKDETIIEYREGEELISEIATEERDITKITLAGNKKIINGINKIIEQEGIECWTDIGATKFPSRLRHNYRLDITAGETSKGKAVEFLSEYTGIRDFVCIGNGPNDLSMFRYALDCKMPVVVIKNHDSSESRELIEQVQEYAKEIGQADKVTISNFPINGYIDKLDERKSMKQKREQFIKRIERKVTPKINEVKRDNIRIQRNNRGR